MSPVARLKGCDQGGYAADGAEKVTIGLLSTERGTHAAARRLTSGHSSKASCADAGR